ncbi:LptA/OstA family protein [Treponema sp.]|uniref:LptA/OstA family protein n=1 Tax=Treponema sp. TaxID=166 RepID=UPI003FA2D065
MYMIRRFILSSISFCMLAASAYAAPAKISFSADKMQGSGGKGNSSTALTGNAQVSVDSLTIYGERIELYGKDYRYIKASGTVTGEDPEKGFTFSAASLLYDRETEVAEFMGAAKVEDTKNKVETAAERIEYNQKNEIILLQMAVHLKSKEIVCDSLFAVYNRTTSMLDLTGRPVVKKGKDEFKAARISVDLNTEDIRLEGKVSGSVTEEKESSATKADNLKTDAEEADTVGSPAQETSPEEAQKKMSDEKAPPDAAKAERPVQQKQGNGKNPEIKSAGGIR